MTASRAPQRRRLTVHGTVQGVGFRPFVYRTARSLGLRGWVQNTGGGVVIDGEAPPEKWDAMIAALRQDAPPLASVDAVQSESLPPAGYDAFRIRASEASGRLPVVPPDVALCADCRRELLDPRDRRYHYPFINCTNCGPRFSVITALPYDRPNTTMAGFTLCRHCRAEYENPADRRFHAQPNACPECGPQLALWDDTGAVGARRDAALGAAAEAVRDGAVVAVKGLGGFHLIVDARNEDAVEALRQRKRRPAKPLALMAPDLDTARALVALDGKAKAALTSHRAPIVLAPRAAEAAAADAVAPTTPELGVMLPYTPLHVLLLQAVGGPVVATSGNRAEEPICIDEHEARQRLGGIADWFLVHDRPIARQVDDSVVRVMAGEARVLRRARGCAPTPLTLPSESSCDGTLAAGGHLKATVALGVSGCAVLSQHIGDLETPEAVQAHERVAADLPDFFAAAPQRLACDLHPDYRSTQWAQTKRLPRQGVQHHAAHVFSAMAEHGLPHTAPALGVSWDGTGLGEDGAVWGGEFFRMRDGAAERVASFRPFALPGGEAAIRAPWRTACALLAQLETDADEDEAPYAALAEAANARTRRLVRDMLQRGFHSPETSSAGRLFDAAAALLGLCFHNRFEGEAAMALEAAAARAAPRPGDGYRMPVVAAPPPAPARLDWRPTLQRLLADRRAGLPPEACAARLHDGLVEAIHAVAAGRDETDIVLTGGCFQNRLLLEDAEARLRARGFRVLLHKEIPPNDGGLALGQLYACAGSDEESASCA